MDDGGLANSISRVTQFRPVLRVLCGLRAETRAVSLGLTSRVEEYGLDGTKTFNQTSRAFVFKLPAYV
jgi:hypothetical protein